MDVKVFPGRLSGTIDAPPSTSIAHRAILCAMMSGGSCHISNLELSDEIQATINGAKALYHDGLTVDCRESAATLRFLMILLAALGRRTTFVGGARLAERPLEPLVTFLNQNGVICRTSGAEGSSERFPITIEGKLAGPCLRIRGDVCSRFISGLLMALPLMEPNAEIVLETPLASKDYARLTLDVMRSFGIHLKATDYGWRCEGRQFYRPVDFTIEGGYAGAVYYLCANLLPKTNVTITGLLASSKQPDRAILNILPALGNGLEIDVKDIPDSAPALAMIAAYAEGTTSLFNAGRFRYEAERMELLCQNILSLGGEAMIEGDRLIVQGKSGLAGGVSLPTGGDYRIAMASIIGVLGCSKPVIVEQAESINLSYPNFFRDFAHLGGVVEIIR